MYCERCVCIYIDVHFVKKYCICILACSWLRPMKDLWNTNEICSVLVKEHDLTIHRVLISWGNVREMF
jgi:hypothetical protein